MKALLISFLLTSAVLAAPFPTHWGEGEFVEIGAPLDDFTTWIDTAGSPYGGFHTVAVRDDAGTSRIWLNGSTVVNGFPGLAIKAVQVAESADRVLHLAFFEGNEVRYGRRVFGEAWSFETVSQTASPALLPEDAPLDLLVSNRPDGTESVTLAWRASGGQRLRVARRENGSTWQELQLSATESLTPRLSEGRWPGSSSLRTGPTLVWIDSAAEEVRYSDFGSSGFPVISPPSWSVPVAIDEIPVSAGTRLDGLAISGSVARIAHRTINVNTSNSLGIFTATVALGGVFPFDQPVFVQGLASAGLLSVSGDGVPFYLYARNQGERDRRCITTRGTGNWQDRSLSMDPTGAPASGPFLGLPPAVFATSAGNAWREVYATGGRLFATTHEGPGLFLRSEQRLLGREVLPFTFLPNGTRIEAYAGSFGSINIRTTPPGTAVGQDQLLENLPVGDRVYDIAVAANDSHIAVVYEASGVGDTRVDLILLDHDLNRIRSQTVATFDPSIPGSSPASERVSDAIDNASLAALMDSDTLFVSATAMNLRTVSLSTGAVTAYPPDEFQSSNKSPDLQLGYGARSGEVLGNFWTFDKVEKTFDEPLFIPFSGTSSFIRLAGGRSTSLHISATTNPPPPPTRSSGSIIRADFIPGGDVDSKATLAVPLGDDAGTVRYTGVSAGGELTFYAVQDGVVRAAVITADDLDRFPERNFIGSDIQLRHADLSFPGAINIVSQINPLSARSFASIADQLGNRVWFIEELDPEYTGTFDYFPFPPIVDTARDRQSGDVTIRYRIPDEATNTPLNYYLETSVDGVFWRTGNFPLASPTFLDDPDPLRPGENVGTLTFSGDRSAADVTPSNLPPPPVSMKIRDIDELFFRIRSQ